jgi:hypothetical protein
MVKLPDTVFKNFKRTVDLGFAFFSSFCVKILKKHNDGS